MCRRRIAFVHIPAISRILHGSIVHIIIAGCLGKYRGGCDIGVATVATHHGGVLQATTRLETVAVDKHMPGPHAQGIESAVHGKDRGVENVDAVDFSCGARCYGPRHGRFLYHGYKRAPARIAELLGIVEPRVGEAVGQNDGCRKHGAGEAAAASLVASCLAHSRVKAGGKGFRQRFHS